MVTTGSCPTGWPRCPTGWEAWSACCSCRNVEDHSARGCPVGKINWGRVILGGLLAGLVLNVVDFVYYGMVMKQDMAAAMQALGKPPIPDSMIWVFVVWDFVMGIGLVWLYAAIRPRFGPGAIVHDRSGRGADQDSAGVRRRGLYLHGGLTGGVEHEKGGASAAPPFSLPCPSRPLALRCQRRAGQDVGNDLARRQAARVALRLGHRHHRGHIATGHGDRNIRQPTEAARVGPARALLPEQRVAALVHQRFHEHRVKAHGRDRRRWQLAGVLTNLGQIEDRLRLAAAEPIGLGAEQDQLLVPNDRDRMTRVRLSAREVERELELARNRDAAEQGALRVGRRGDLVEDSLILRSPRLELRDRKST